MISTLRRLALVTACAAALSTPALARDRWRGGRDRVVIVVHSRDFDRDDGWRYGGWDRGRRVGWRGCDLPPGLARRYGCYNRPVGLVPRYYRPRSGVSFFFNLR